MNGASERGAGSPVVSPEAYELCGVPMRGPILNGSGTFDAIAARRAFGDALLERFPFDCFVSKTITVEPRAGNPSPRLWETPAGMINSIGLPNKGYVDFLAEDLPRLAELPVPLCVSVMGFTHDELATLVGAVQRREEIALIELNVSCPNVETGTVMGADPSERHPEPSNDSVAPPAMSHMGKRGIERGVAAGVVKQNLRAFDLPLQRIV